MKGNVARLVGLSAVLLAAVCLTLGAGHAAKPVQTRIGLPTDWSHRHVIFSNTATSAQAARVQQDPRFLQQQMRRNLRLTVPAQPAEGRESLMSRILRRHKHHRMHRDWSVDMGPGTKVGAGNFPAKFSFSGTTANCGLAATPDYVVYGTGVLGSPTQSSLVAFTNLYAGPMGCSGPVPATYWAYNTGGQILTSPVLSLDGTQVAFTQTDGVTASLVLVKWSAFNGSDARNPQTPATVLASAYPTCTAPCMTLLPLVHNDTTSSVFYDYGLDTAWVGDDSGQLHQFTTVFRGTPTEVTTGGWPVSVSASVLTSPVHDVGSDSVFVGDHGGFLYRVDSTGAVTTSSQLDFGSGITEGPIVDSSAGLVYVFSSKDSVGSAGVFQLTTAFAGGTSGAEALVGTGTAGSTPMYDGAFDNTYINSTDTSGNLYVCGNTGGAPTLYQIAIQAKVMGTVTTGPVLATASPVSCSPITEVFNPTVSGQGTPTEWVFLSVQGAGAPSGCFDSGAGGQVSCAMSFRITAWQPNMTYNVGQEVLDSNFNIQVAENQGTSGATAPAWMTGVFTSTLDGTVHWQDQGRLSTPTPPFWTPTTAFAGAAQIIDSNNNIEIALLSGGTSAATPPTWPTVEGDTVTDNDITWTNLGGNPINALKVPGGTSGIIIDNILDLPGSSQVYFSTLQDGACSNSGGAVGGCAVQASQQGLQ
jgi:hypothetical protein